MTHDLETRLHDGLDHEAAQAPPEPALGDVISLCERDLVRHRRRFTVAAVAAVAAGVAVAAGIPILTDGSSTRSDDVASAPALVDAGVDLDGEDPATLIAACKAGAQTQEWTDLMFWPGPPRIVAYSSAIDQTSTVLVSADGTMWADCFNADKSLDGANTVMNVFIPRPSSMAPISAGLACADQPEAAPCIRFVIDKVDRLPTEVKQVEFRTLDGATTTVQVDRYGFVIFDYEGAAPERYLGDRTPPRVPWISQMTYLDGSGNVLAANRWTKTTLVPQRIAGTPELSAYPSLSLPPDQMEDNVPITPAAGER